jgi:hypothetical protein
MIPEELIDASYSNGVSDGKKIAIDKLRELNDRTPPEYLWIKMQIESTIKQIQDGHREHTGSDKAS